MTSKGRKQQWVAPTLLDMGETSAHESAEDSLASLHPGGRSSTGAPHVFLSRVKIRNYKSIETCDVCLKPLTVLVGRNGSGKSNFLDALRFVSDGLTTSLDHAVKSRGGIDEVRRRSTGHPRNFAIELELNLPSGQKAIYGFEIAAQSRGGFIVRREELSVIGKSLTYYQLENAKLRKATDYSLPPAAPDRLYLVTASGLSRFREVYDCLRAMGFYNLNPEVMRGLQSPDPGELLRREGQNIASVIAQIGANRPELKERIKGYLNTIVPGIKDVDRVSLGPKETLEFRQEVVGSKAPWKFYAASMSDGTLRALGALVAVTQLAGGAVPARLVGIEEPETALHPAAAGALVDALREAAVHTQVLITTHSPELLDGFESDSDSDCLLAVQARQGTSEIAPIDLASRKSIQTHLTTPGELLRMDQLEPDKDDLERQKQMRMFEKVGGTG